MRSQTVCPCDASSSAVSSGSSHFGLADLAPQVLLRVAELADLGVRELERLEQNVLGHLVGAGLDHRQASRVPTTIRSRVDSSRSAAASG